MGSGPSGIAFGTTFLWTANSGEGTSSRLNPETNTADLTIPGLDEPVGVVSGRADQEGKQLAKGIWITNSGSDSVSRITAEGDIVSTVPDVGAKPTGIVIASDERVWVAAEDDDALAIIEPIAEPLSGGDAGALDGEPVSLKGEGCDAPRSLAVGFGSIWVACAGSGTVVRLNESSGEVQGSTNEAGPSPQAIATDGEGVWVTSSGESGSDDGTVTFLDPDEV